MGQSLTSSEPVNLGKTIVLVGLMGAGKTTVGRRLAQSLGLEFVDSDAEIEIAANMCIPEIFETFDEQYFREGELRVIKRLLRKPPHILATGGGAYISPEIRALIQQNAVSVWINVGLETLWDRVNAKPGRPLLEKDNPKAVLAALQKARYPIYAKADITVQSQAGNTHDAVVKNITTALISGGYLTMGKNTETTL
ncbi:MAG: shikimate kinase [Paracoccaceae bacterium]